MSLYKVILFYNDLLQQESEKLRTLSDSLEKDLNQSCELKFGLNKFGIFTTESHDFHFFLQQGKLYQKVDNQRILIEEFTGVLKSNHPRHSYKIEIIENSSFKNYFN